FTTTVFSNTGTITINDQAPATPYPATIAVSGVYGNVLKATVGINGLSHTFIGDVGMLSIGPSGSSTIMLYSTGLSGNVSNANYTFEDAGGACPNSGASGTYRPTTSGVVPNLPAGAPAGPYGPALFRHNGGSANGTWSLYLEDHGPGDFGSVANGWT